MKTVAIVHFNTPTLTEAAVASIRKHTPGCRIVIFDNSDRLPYPATRDIDLIDNTAGQIVNFNKMLERYRNKARTIYYHASAKHIETVDRLFDFLPEGFVLMDSDALVKKDISPFFDSEVAWTGEVELHPAETYKTPRLLPYLLWINVPMCRENGIRFKSEGRIYKMSHTGAPYHDTGASFWEDCTAKGLPHHDLPIYEYINHYGGASYSGNKADIARWLDENKELYQ